MTTSQATNMHSNHLSDSPTIVASTSATTTSTLQQELLQIPQEIEDPPPVVEVSMTMIASTLLLRIPIVESDDDDDDDDDDDQYDQHDKEDSGGAYHRHHHHRKNHNNKNNIALQLTAWLDQYHEQRQSTEAVVGAGLGRQQLQQRHDSISQSTKTTDTIQSNPSARDVVMMNSGGDSSNIPTRKDASDSHMIHLTSKECYNDFIYLQQCRQHIHVILQHIYHYYQTHQTVHDIMYPEDKQETRSSARGIHPTRYDQNFKSSQQQQQSKGVPFIEYAMEELQNYVAVLQEFIHQGFPANENDGLGFLSFTWFCPIKYEEEHEGEIDDEDKIDGENTKKNKQCYETHYSLSWECINVLYNIAVLYTYRSSVMLDHTTALPPTRAQWTKTGQYLQNAATIVRYIRQTYYVISTSTAHPVNTNTNTSTPDEVELTSLSNHTDSNHSTKTINTTATTNSTIIWYNSVLLCSSKFLEVLQLHLLAEAQRAAYQTFVATNLPSSTNQITTNTNTDTPSSSVKAAVVSTTSPPKHFILAKLAAAAAPLYLAVEDLCQGNINQYESGSDPSDECDDEEDHQIDIVKEELYYDSSETIDQNGTRRQHSLSQMTMPEQSSSQSGAPTSTGSGTATPQPPAQVLQWSTTRFIQEWEDSVRAYGMWMTTLAEYHQSWVHRKRNSSGGRGSNPTTTDCGMEIARLEGALKFADYCRDFCESTTVQSVQMLLPQIKQLVQEMEVRFDIAKREFDQICHDSTIPDHDELPEIQQILSVKTDLENINKLLPSLNPERVALFSNVIDPKLRTYIDMFRMKVQKVITQTEQLANRQTEIAREQLAAVNLPHSITTYRQQQCGGGLPSDIWNRIVPIQEQCTIEQFSREVWSIRKRSDSANDIIQQIHAQLIDVLEIDAVFRQTNSQFVGHDVQQIQKIFHPILQTYDEVLSSARTSDDLLLKRCDVFDTDPKFRLLKLQKSQLDRLFPPLKAAEHDAEHDGSIFDTNTLRGLLVDLSKLFSHRETIIHTLQEYGKTYDISKELMDRGSNASDGMYQQVVDMALASLQPLVNEIRMNLEKQGKLIYKIKSENEQFMKVRNYEAQRRMESKVSMQGGPIVKIYDALEEVESFEQHIQQGKEFYDVVIPKLQKLYEQIYDVSGRLSKERMEYEKLPRRSQRRPPARDGYNRNSSSFDTRNVDGCNDQMGMAYSAHMTEQQFSRPNVSPTPPQMVEDRMSQQSRPTLRPETASLTDAQVYVDDEKVASLVSMDFDPTKAVAALKRHNNDIELALNELLAG